MSNGSRYRRWGFVDAADPASSAELDELRARMAAYYAREASREGYWVQAESQNSTWQPTTHPFHCELASLIPSGATVVDFGCGSAHAVNNLASEITYVGIEGSPPQVSANRERFPQHRFIQGDMLADHQLAGSADWAVSFFAIEHCARPDLLLKRMVDTCKPGGRVAILCPNFERGMNSLRSGSSAFTRREKVRRGRILDALIGYAEERWLWPHRVRAVHSSAMLFPIYLQPRCFDAPYFSDNDAIYLTSETKLARSLQDLECEIESTSASVNAPAEIKSGIISLVARRLR